MKNKPYKEVNTWKRHNIQVRLVEGEGEFENVVNKENFKELNNLKQVIAKTG